MARDSWPEAGDPSQPDPEVLALSLLGHDLRAALAEVQGQLRLVAGLALPPDAADQVARCTASGEALSRLLDQSIAVCLGQASPDLTGNSDVALDELLATLRLRWSGHAAAAGAGFCLVVAGKAPTISLDRTALERVLSNLLANALRHGGQGQVQLEADFRDSTRLQFRVTDEGPGFAADHLPHLQRDFALPPAARRPGGGLGLQSVRRLVLALGGTVALRNRQDRPGAEVLVCLPAVPPRHGAAKADGPPALLLGWSILIVDDSPSCREILAETLRQRGAQVMTCADGEAALGLLGSGGFDLALIDEELPGLKGHQVIAMLRAGGESPDDPAVIALTAHHDPEVASRLSSAGADRVLQKPAFDPDVLAAAAQAALGARGGPPPLRPEALGRLQELAGPELGKELISRLREDLVETRRGLLHAAAAVDIAGLRRHSHALIALAGTAGAARLQALAQTLNGLGHGTAGQSGPPVGLISAVDRRLAALMAALARSEGAAP